MNPVHQKASIPRLLLLIILVVGLLGTGVELLLLGHTEDVWQWVPLVLLAAGLIIIGIWVRRRRRWSLRTFQATMLLCVVAGPVGIHRIPGRLLRLFRHRGLPLRGPLLERDTRPELSQAPAPAVSPGQATPTGRAPGAERERKETPSFLTRVHSRFPYPLPSASARSIPKRGGNRL